MKATGIVRRAEFNYHSKSIQISFPLDMLHSVGITDTCPTVELFMADCCEAIGVSKYYGESDNEAEKCILLKSYQIPDEIRKEIVAETKERLEGQLKAQYEEKLHSVRTYHEKEKAEIMEQVKKLEESYKKRGDKIKSLKEVIKLLCSED
ncbi:MAG: hypothetical protein EOM67_16215 [Spirochaetia bacterium]|nr:hypothetical protein [Spirochaetia bacterium]